MPIRDPKTAREVLSKYQGLVESGNYSEAKMMSSLVLKIGVEIDPSVSIRMRRLATSFPSTYDLDDLLEVTEQLVWRLDNEDKYRQIFGPVGPALEASRLHECVWTAAASRWDSGHYSDAVHRATQAVEVLAANKLGRRDLRGADLYNAAFGRKNPKRGEVRLRLLRSLETSQPKDFESANQGLHHLGLACAGGIRNPQAHPSPDLDEQEALEQLATLSLLARWVDASEVVRAESSEAGGG